MQSESDQIEGSEGPLTLYRYRITCVGCPLSLLELVSSTSTERFDCRPGGDSDRFVVGHVGLLDEIEHRNEVDELLSLCILESRRDRFGLQKRRSHHARKTSVR